MIALIKSNDVGKLKTLDVVEGDIKQKLETINKKISGSITTSVLLVDKKRKNDTILKAIDKFDALKDLKGKDKGSELDNMGLDTEIDLLEQTILKDFMEVNLELLKLNHEKADLNEKAGIEENILKDEKALADINSGIAALTAKAKAIKTTKKELKKIESSKNKSELTQIKEQLKQDKTNGNHAHYNNLKSNLSDNKSIRATSYETSTHKDSIEIKINDLNEQITRLQTESQEATTATATDGEGTQAKSTYGMGSITKLFKSSNESKINKLEAQKTKLENQKKLLDDVEKMTDPEAKVDSQLDLMESFFKEGIDNAKKEITQLETQEKNPENLESIKEIKTKLIETRTALDQLEQKLDVVQTEKEVRANIRAAAGDEVSQLKTTLGEVKTSAANAKELLQELALGESVEGGMDLVDKEIAALEQKVVDLGQQKYTSKDMERISNFTENKVLLKAEISKLTQESNNLKSSYNPLSPIDKSVINELKGKFEKQVGLIDKYIKAEAKAEAKIKDDIVKRLYLKMGKVPSEQANTIREKIELVKDKETDKTKLLSLLALEKATALLEELDEIRNEESRIKGETDEMLDTKLELFELQLTDAVKTEKSLNKDAVKAGTLKKRNGGKKFSKYKT